MPRNTLPIRNEKLVVGLSLIVLLVLPGLALAGAKKNPRASKTPTLVWPLPPEKPRIKFVGANYGAADVEPAKNSGFLDRLAGIIDVNIKATMALTHLLLPELRKQEGAAVINVASLAAFYPMPAMAVYAASKSFILNFTLALRAELRDSAVRVSALCPAGMVTNRDTADQVKAQGFFGRITTWLPENVAEMAIRQALRGKAVIIPGLANRVIRLLGEAVPRRLVVNVIGKRWRSAERALRETAPVRGSPIASDSLV